MRTARWTLVIPLLFSGCTPEEPAAHALRESLSTAIHDSKHLVLLEIAYIPDGGSILFFLKTDSGIPFEILALHRDSAMGGNSKYQEFRIQSYKDKAEFKLKRGSPLESELVALLETCLLGNKAPPGDRDLIAPG